jgi:hypothetical protein
VSDPTSEYRDEPGGDPGPCCPYCGMGLSASDLLAVDEAAAVQLDALMADVLGALYWDSDAEYLDATDALLRDEQIRARYRQLTGRKLRELGRGR